jgi:Flavin-binding monooxygenase-like
VGEITEKTALFEDGSRETIDAIVFGTGYEIHLPFLASDILKVINTDGTHIDLYRHTFHPDLPNLAFLGLYVQIGPYFPVLELQGRWIALVWSGVKPLPTREKMMDGIREFQKWKMVHYETRFDEMAVMLSTEADVAPALDKHPELAKALLFGPLASSQFRLDGHGKHQDAAKEFVSAASSFGNITSPNLTDEQMARLTMLASALKNDESVAALLRIFQERSQPSE